MATELGLVEFWTAMRTRSAKEQNTTGAAASVCLPWAQSPGPRFALPVPPVALLVDFHGASLRILSDRLGCHFQGLGAAAREARKKGFISNRICNRIVAADVAFNMVRHITAASCKDSVETLNAGCTKL